MKRFVILLILSITFSFSGLGHAELYMHVEDLKDVQQTDDVYISLKYLSDQLVLTEPINDGLFRPKENLNRQELVNFLSQGLYRISKLYAAKGSKQKLEAFILSPISLKNVSDFKDVQTNAAYYENLKRLIKYYKFAMGDTTSTGLMFEPDKVVTKKEAALLFAQFLGDTMIQASEAPITREEFIRYLALSVREAKRRSFR